VLPISPADREWESANGALKKNARVANLTSPATVTAEGPAVAAADEEQVTKDDFANRAYPLGLRQQPTLAEVVMPFRPDVQVECKKGPAPAGVAVNAAAALAAAAAAGAAGAPPSHSGAGPQKPVGATVLDEESS
jgi:hypothetical protein